MPRDMTSQGVTGCKRRRADMANELFRFGMYQHVPLQMMTTRESRFTLGAHELSFGSTALSMIFERLFPMQNLVAPLTLIRGFRRVVTTLQVRIQRILGEKRLPT